MRHFILIAIIFASLVIGVNSEPFNHDFVYDYTIRVDKVTPGIFVDSYKLHSAKTEHFDPVEGQITYFRGIFTSSTNLLVFEILKRAPDSIDHLRVGYYEVYYNRYAPGGMLTNHIEDPISVYRWPSGDWFVGKIIAKSDLFRNQLSCSFAKIYNNTANLGNWVARDTFTTRNGRMIRFDTYIGAQNEVIFFPSLKEASKINGSSIGSYILHHSTVFEPVMFPWVYGEEFQQTRKKIRFGSRDI